MPPAAVEMLSTRSFTFAVVSPPVVVPIQTTPALENERELVAILPVKVAEPLLVMAPVAASTVAGTLRLS